MGDVEAAAAEMGDAEAIVEGVAGAPSGHSCWFSGGGGGGG